MPLSEIIPKRRTLEEAYNAGYDCGKQGPNEGNCHFTLFFSPEMSLAWDQGKFDADSGIPRRELYT